MSTQIAEVKGDAQIAPEYAGDLIRERRISMNVTSFSGGIKRGAMIQLSLETGGYIQLPAAEVEILRDALTKWLER